MKLVGVDGAYLQVQGSVTVELEMSGHIFSQELIAKCSDIRRNSWIKFP